MSFAVGSIFGGSVVTCRLAPSIGMSYYTVSVISVFLGPSPILIVSSMSEYFAEQFEDKR